MLIVDACDRGFDCASVDHYVYLLIVICRNSKMICKDIIASRSYRVQDTSEFSGRDLAKTTEITYIELLSDIYNVRQKGK